MLKKLGGWQEAPCCNHLQWVRTILVQFAVATHSTSEVGAQAWQSCTADIDLHDRCLLL